jgi:hypothetical protein
MVPRGADGRGGPADCRERDGIPLLSAGGEGPRDRGKGLVAAGLEVRLPTRFLAPLVPHIVTRRSLGEEFRGEGGAAARGGREFTAAEAGG